MQGFSASALVGFYDKIILRVKNIATKK